MTWTPHPRAAALLAQCVASPPRTREATYRFGDKGTLYTGQIVQELRALRNKLQPPIDTPEWREWLGVDEQRAIADALFQARHPRKHRRAA